jgi:hypothetical protein
LDENKTQGKIKILHLNNGGEYTFAKINYLYREPRIKRELIVSYTPYKNGVAKRKNEFIVETTKSLIHDMDFPMIFWVKDCNALMYILKKYPHKNLKDMTPREEFIFVKPNVSYLHVFGCPIYIHVPKEKKTMLKPSSIKGIFFG